MNFEEYDRIIEKMECGEQLEPEEWGEGISVLEGRIPVGDFDGGDEETSWTAEDDMVFKAIREDMTSRGLLKAKKRKR